MTNQPTSVRRRGTNLQLTAEQRGEFGFDARLDGLLFLPLEIAVPLFQSRLLAAQFSELVFELGDFRCEPIMVGLGGCG